MKRKIAVITGTRAEYGLLKFIMRKIQLDKSLELCLIVTGAHLSQNLGNSIEEILDDGFEIDAKVDILMSSDTPESISKSMGLGVISFTQVFQQFKPDIILILGDRFELLAASTAALPFNIAIAHIAGGEITEGAIDERIRHAITKLSHIHFTCAEQYRENVLKLAEEEWRVINVGHPCLEIIDNTDLLTKNELSIKYNLNPNLKIYLVTIHTTTLNSEEEEYIQIRDFFEVIRSIENVNIIITYPNADTNSHIILDKIEELRGLPNIIIVPNLGSLNYLSMMKISDLVIGNSSSGLVEGPYFKVPIINYGDRQKGRLKATNIIDSLPNKTSLINAIDIALNDFDYRSSLETTNSIYGVGQTSSMIVNVLAEVPLDRVLFRKKFANDSN